MRDAHMPSAHMRRRRRERLGALTTWPRHVRACVRALLACAPARWGWLRGAEFARAYAHQNARTRARADTDRAAGRAQAHAGGCDFALLRVWCVRCARWARWMCEVGAVDSRLSRNQKRPGPARGVSVSVRACVRACVRCVFARARASLTRSGLMRSRLARSSSPSARRHSPACQGRAARPEVGWSATSLTASRNSRLATRSHGL